MLVLSRRLGQSIQFPSLGIAVDVVQIKGNTVRLGIDAPSEIPVLRQELVGEAWQPSTALESAALSANKSVHRMRGQINSAVMALYLAEKQIQNGLSEDADKTLANAIRQLESLDTMVQGISEKPKLATGRRTLGALIVEDNLNEEALLGSYLELSGVHVDAVHNGDEAIEYLATHERPDFILLDMHMPKKGGPAVLAQLRNQSYSSETRIFAVTGSWPEELGVDAKEAGVDAWFTKPVNPSRIVQAMFESVNN